MTSVWTLRHAQPRDHDGWARLRHALWPDASLEEHLGDLSGFLVGDTVGFIATDAAGEAIAFAEASLRHEYVNGTGDSPVGFLEGWYVVPAWRGRGIGQALLGAVEAWTREQGCAELASDTQLDNLAAQAAHRACGFEETERVVYYRKTIRA